MTTSVRTSIAVSRRLPWATLVLILANIAVYAVAGLLDTRAFESLSHDSFLIAWGANVAPLTFSGQFWRLGSSMFLHVGFTHLAMNMIALWAIGGGLERLMPRTAFVGVYLLSGLAGSVVSALWYRNDVLISCGASGAILGLIGATLAYAAMGAEKLPVRDLIVSLVLTFGAGSVFAVDNAAHLGGLVVGFLLGAVVRFATQRPRAQGATLIAAAGAVALIVQAAVCAHFYNPDMRSQLLSAELRHVFGHLGLDSPAAALGGLTSVDNCVDGVLQGDPSAGDPVAALKACAQPQAGDASDADEMRMLSLYLRPEFAHCRSIVARLEPFYPAADTQQTLATVDRYCATRSQLYDVVFGGSAAGFKPDAVVKATADLRALSDADTDDDSGPVHGLKTILDHAGEQSLAVVDASGCPYWSCARWR